MKTRTRTANPSWARGRDPVAHRGSGVGLLLMAFVLFLFVIILWLFIDRREGAMFPIPPTDSSDLRDAPR